MRIAGTRRLAAVFGAAAFLALATGHSHAATFSLTGGEVQNIPDNFNPSGWNDAENDNIGVGTSISVFSNGGPPGGLSVDGPANLIFTFLGAEAGYSNIALINGTQLFENHSTAYGTTSGQYAVGAGFIPFIFRSISAGDKDAVNGGAIDENVEFGIKLISATVAYLFFEDIAICGDGDLEDMVVRVDIAGRDDAPDPTPLPAAIWMFGSAIAGATGFGAWRRRRLAVAA